MKSAINWLIHAYLTPLSLSDRLALYVKGKMLTYDEHYLVTLDVIKRNFADDSGIVIDIGAFDGDSTIFFARRLTKNIIVAFEPNPEPFLKGKKNTERFANIVFHNLGFSDRVGRVNLHVTKNKVSSSLFHLKDLTDTAPEGDVEVNLDTLDNFFKDTKDILLIKLDVQGSELAILKNGTESLKRTKLVLTEMLNSEIYDGSCQYHEVDAFLRSQNFQIHSIITNYNKDGMKYYDALYINAGL